VSSRVSDARTALYDALTAAMAPLPWRSHRVTPAQVVAPAVWLESVELVATTVETISVTVATFPVVIVVDGLERRQIEELDDLIARMWDAVRTAGGEPSSSRPVSLDVGGPNLRAQVIRVEYELVAATLCGGELVTAGAP
jgi:hypothetical protein